PNILSIFDIGNHAGAPYLVTELLEGRTLRETLEGGALARRRAVDYAQQAARGLAAAHEKGIVHRDLKPENLFVINDGRVKVLDFGLAKLTQPEIAGAVLSRAGTIPSQTDSGVILGTVGYMSPEQVRGEKADHRSDIFAFGVILYEMLTGQRAFRRNSAVETLNAILNDEPPEMADSGRQISPALERIVRRCLEKNPGQRFQSASDLAFALEALAAPSGSSGQTLAQASVASRQRARWLLAAVTVVALVSLAFFAGRLTGNKSPSSPSFNRLTFRRGNLSRARIAPDGQTVVYAASWEGRPLELFTTRLGSPESRPLGITNADVVAISATGEMAITLWRENGMTLAQVPLVGGAPRELLEDSFDADWSPDGKGLAALHQVNGRQRIEYPLGTAIYETPTALGGDIRFSPRGGLIAVTERATDGLWTTAVIDLSGKKQVLSTGWRRIQGIAWNPAGDEVWFTASQNGAHALYAATLAARERLVARVPGKMGIQDISRDGRVLFEQDINRAAMICLPAGETQGHSLSWLDGSVVADISADGKTILFNEDREGGGDQGAIYLRRTAGSAAIRLGEGVASALSPDGRWVLATTTGTAQRQLMLLPTGAGETKLLDRGEVQAIIAQSAGWFPDGRRILFTGRDAAGKTRLYVQDVNGGRPEPVLGEGLSNGVISPDGRMIIAFGPDRRLMLFPLDGGAPRALPGIERADTLMRCGGDGRSLFLIRGRDIPAGIYRYDLATGRRELLREVMPPDPDYLSSFAGAQVTPDGKTIVYSYANVLSTLYLVDGLK